MLAATLIAPVACTDATDPPPPPRDDAGAPPGVDATVRRPGLTTARPPAICSETEVGPIYVESAGDLGVDFFAPYPSELGPGERDRDYGGGAVVADLTGDDFPDLVFTATNGAPALYVSDRGRGFELRGRGHGAP